MVKEKTIRELVNRVAAGTGYDTDMESVCAYQDLLGHATIEENRELANDRALNEAFYRIYGVAYGTLAAIKFYMDNSNKVTDLKGELEDYKVSYEGKCKELQIAQERIEAQKEKIATLEGQIAECKRDMDGTLQNIQYRDDDIIRLKAKMYDLMEEVEMLRAKVRKEQS